MPKNKDFARRIEILDECLRRRQKKWFIEDLLETVNNKLVEKYDKKISKRSLYNDLEYLQNEKLAPIIKCWEGRRVYYRYKDLTYSVLNLPITNEEVLKLKDAIKMLREVNDFNLLDDVDTIVKKLEHSISTKIVDNISFIQFEKHTIANGVEHIDDLYSAIKNKLVLRIAYQPFGSSLPHEWIIHPYLLKEFRNRWFVIGRREGSDRISNLALDRIKKIQNSSLAYIENNLFNSATFYEHLIGVTFPAKEDIQDIILKIKGRQINYIKTKPIHKSQEIIEEPDENSIIIKLRVINNYELQSILLSYTPDIEVIEPIELKNLLKEKYINALSFFR